MRPLSSYAQFIQDEVLRDIPGITFKRMFSGYGVYKDGVIFGMLLSDVLYFKTNETTRLKYTEQGSKPFSFTKGGKEIVTKYYEVPPHVLEDTNEIAKWIDEALHT